MTPSVLCHVWPRPRRCFTLSTHACRQSWMAVCPDSTLQMTKQSTGWQNLERWTANKRRRRHVISIEKQTSPFPSSSGSAIIVPDPQMSIPALTVRYFHGKDIVCGPKTFASNYNRSQNHAAKPTPNVKSSQCISDKIFVLLYIIVFWLLTFLFFVKW